LVCGLALAAFASCAQATEFKVLHSFNVVPDGEQPIPGVIMDKAHKLYGTTRIQGTGSGGTVYELAPDGTLSVLHAFADDGSDNGFEPMGGLISDAAGNLFGTTLTNVFKVAPDGTETVLYDFSGGHDGQYPLAGLARDRMGNLYGTTVNGGSVGCGVVFKLKPDGRESVLYAFKCGADGGYPESGLLLKSGEFYGTTYGGGDAKFGTIFKVSRHGGETALHAFTGQDGKFPEYGTPIMDQAGDLYGMASKGGAADCGTIWKLAPGGSFTVLYSFSGADGCQPEAGLLSDAAGNFYGTTEAGGAHGGGTVFELAADGLETVLHSFDGSDGSEPSSTLIADKKGNLYGTTAVGGAYEAGTIFRLKP
jgi:uncharacterized repeat protein (TIGR03803 family)